MPEAWSSKRILSCESKNKGHYDFECHWRYLFDRWYRIYVFSAVFFPCSFHSLCLIFEPDIENIPWYLMLFCLTAGKSIIIHRFSPVAGVCVCVFKCMVFFCINIAHTVERIGTQNECYFILYLCNQLFSTSIHIYIQLFTLV